MDEKMLERQKYKEETKQKVKSVINSKPLYKLYEEKFKQEVEMPELEQKKKQLEDLRNLYRPIQKNDLQEHAMNYERQK